MIDNSEIYTFLLILVRISSFFVTAPIFSSKTVPVRFKFGFSFFIALVIFPSITVDEQLTLNGTFIFYIITEAILGLAIGWVAQLVFSSIQIAGAFIDLQIGFSMANVIDPQTGAQTPLMGNLKYIFAVLLLLTLNVHHQLIDGIIASFYMLPLTGDWIGQLSSENMMVFIMSTFSKMFLIAFKISAPIVVTLLIVDIALGIIARTFPQLNVFIVGITLKIIITFILLFAVAMGLLYSFEDLFNEMISSIKQFMELMGL